MSSQDIFGKAHRGLEAVDVYRFSLGQQGVLILVEDILVTSYFIYMGIRGRDFIFESFEQLKSMLASGEDAALTNLFRERASEFSKSGMRDVLDEYKKEGFRRAVMLLRLEGLDAHLIDVGASDNGLGVAILKGAGPRAVITGVDVEPAPLVQTGPNLRFVIQEAPGVLPLENASGDLVAFRFSLHHMTWDVQEHILKEAFRVLRSNGSIVIVEDTYSLSLKPIVGNNLYTRFVDLTPYEQRYALALLDTSSRFIVNDEMPFAFTYRTIEDWCSILSKIGFSVGSVEYWGLPFFSVQQAPLGVIWGSKQ